MTKIEKKKFKTFVPCDTEHTGMIGRCMEFRGWELNA